MNSQNKILVLVHIYYSFAYEWVFMWKKVRAGCSELLLHLCGAEAGSFAASAALLLELEWISLVVHKSRKTTS